MKEITTAHRVLRRELRAYGLTGRIADELAQHFADLLDERLAAGDPLEVAIAAARTRLGDVAALAREHARVTPAFGPPPPRAAAWGAVAAMLVWHLLGSDVFIHGARFLAGLGALRGLVLGPGALLGAALIGLLARRPEAGAFVLGVAAAHLVLALMNGVLEGPEGVLAGAPVAIGFVAMPLAVGALLGTTLRMTRASVAMIALGFTSVSAAGPGQILLDPGFAAALPLLVTAAALAVALRARIAPLACAVLGIAIVPPVVTNLAAVWTMWIRTSSSVIAIVALTTAVLAPWLAAALTLRGRPTRAAAR